MDLNRFFLIDALGLLYRAYYVLPQMNLSDGLPTNALYGISKMIFKLLNDYKFDYAVVVFDSTIPTFREIEFPQYKAKRVKMPDDLKRQIPISKEIFSAFGFKSVLIEGFEADDVIASFVKESEKFGIYNIIISGDKDLLQLISEKTNVFFTKKGLSEFVKYGIEEFYKEFNIMPKQLIDKKCLGGDKSDNIPGLPGIGELTAVKLLKQFGNIDELYKNLEQIKDEKLRKILTFGKDDVYRFRKIVSLNCEINYAFNLNEFKFNSYDSQKLNDIFNRLNFKSLIKYIEPGQVEVKQKQLEFKMC